MSKLEKAALTQALATTERTLNDTLRDIDAATCPECGGLGVSDPGAPDSPDGPGRPAVDCKPCKGTGWRNGVHLTASQPATTERVPNRCAQCKKEYRQNATSIGCPKCAPGVRVSEDEFQKPIATTERKGEPRPVAWIHDWSKSSDQVGQILSWSSESPYPDKVTVIPLYTSPQVPEDVQRDAERWRELLKYVGADRQCGGYRFTLYDLRPIKGANPMQGAVCQHFAQAIDAARKGE